MRLVFQAAIFLGSALLFLVQPMVAKLVLPLLGGGPAVWTTCVLFFQATLLAGYLAAHLTARLDRRVQFTLFLGAGTLPLLAAALFQRAVVAAPEGWAPPAEGSPIPWLLVCLGVMVGAPFLMLSSASPLLQRWYSWSQDPRAGDPYFLYVAGNTGSLLALMAYPLVVEPALSLSAQRGAWTAAYGCFLLVAAASGALAVRGPVRATEAGTTAASPQPAPATRARWILLACVPASLMLGLTQFLTTDIAAFPLLWVIPLALYLLTYIVAFSRLGPAATRLASLALPAVAVMLIALLMLGQHQPIRLQIGLHLAGLLVAGLACHGQLAAARPDAAHLTEFYLLLSLGGVLGGIFNSLVAASVFTSVAEYPIAILGAALLAGWPAGRPGWWGDHRPGARDLLAPLAVVVAYDLLPSLLGWADWGTRALRTSMLGDPVEIGWTELLRVVLPALGCLAFVRRPLGLALGLGALAAIAPGGFPGDARQIHAERTFFGVHRVLAQPDGVGDWHSLWHGSTLHGRQHQAAPRSQWPSTYYVSSGPVGDVMNEMARRPGDLAIALVGLGTGTLAAYGRPTWSFDYYEIDPAVVRIARDPKLFSYVADSRSRTAFVVGDARRTLSRAPDAHYDLIVLDAFTSDAIPVHLLTREAIQLYLAKLRPAGLLLFHVTNRYVRLAPVLASIAHTLGLAIVWRSDFDLTQQERTDGKYGSDWAVLARHKGDLGNLSADPRWHVLGAPADFREWTDDYSDVLSVLRLW